MRRSDRPNWVSARWTFDCEIPAPAGEGARSVRPGGAGERTASPEARDGEAGAPVRRDDWV
jgi:hypothetical protein